MPVVHLLIFEEVRFILSETDALYHDYTLNVQEKELSLLQIFKDSGYVQCDYLKELSSSLSRILNRVKMAKRLLNLLKKEEETDLQFPLFTNTANLLLPRLFKL